VIIRLLRLARPLLAFKRDLSRPPTEACATVDCEALPIPQTRQGSTSSSSALEIIDIDTAGSFRSIFDKVKNTLTPSTKRRTSDGSHAQQTPRSSQVNAPSDIDSCSTSRSRQPSLYRDRSISLTDSNTNRRDYEHRYSLDDQNKIVCNAQQLADQILLASIDEATTQTLSTCNPCEKFDTTPSDDDENFQRDFHRAIAKRHISEQCMEDVVYQDLSADIVTYILKHALRTVTKEQEQCLSSTDKNIIDQTCEHDDDFIDLK
jgi:hypothetical protein